MIESIHLITGLLVILFMLLNTRRFAVFCFMNNGKVMNDLLRGQFWFTSAMLIQRSYWSIVFPWLNKMAPETWAAISSFLGGADYINALCNSVGVYGLYLILRGGFYMIPEEERKSWTILASAFYPYERCISVRLSRMIQRGDKDEDD